MRRRHLAEPGAIVTGLEAVLVVLLLMLGVVMLRAPRCAAALLELALPAVRP